MCFECDIIEVLNKDKFPFRKADIDWTISTFIDYAISLGRTADSDKDFIDKDDMVFYEVALSKEDSFLVTGNIKHEIAIPMLTIL